MAHTSHYQPDMRMRIGIDSIRGEPEVCILAVGLDRVASPAVAAQGVSSGGRGRWVVAYADGSSVRLRRKSAARALANVAASLGARLRSRVPRASAAAPSWRTVGEYSTVDPEFAALESRSNPRPARVAAHAAKLVLAAALVAVTFRAPGVALIATLSASAAVLAAQLGCWAVAYLRREFVQQWRVLACTLGPAAAFLAWVAVQIHANHLVP